jgi:hypothetical protein
MGMRSVKKVSVPETKSKPEKDWNSRMWNSSRKNQPPTRRSGESGIDRQFVFYSKFFIIFFICVLEISCVLGK